MTTVAPGVFDLLGTTIAIERLAARNRQLLATLLRRPSAATPVRTVRGDGAPSDVLAALTAAVVETSPLLCIHAAVVAGPAGLLAVPGQSGLGKTTLAGALVRAGFGYVSDEALAIDRDTGVVHPFPRPLALDGTSWRVLELGDAAPPEGAEELVPPARFGRVHHEPGRIATILLAERGHGPTALSGASRGAAVAPLLRRSFNHFEAPEASFHAIARVVREATVWRAAYADTAELAAMLARRLLDHASAATRAR